MTHDPELDPPRHAIHRRLEPESLRLLANPFLGYLALLLWGVAFAVTLRHKNVILLPLLLFALIGLVFLFQFHCLDCGVTGPLFFWKDHACEGSRQRDAEAHRTRFPRLPNPATQTLLWTYLTLAVALLTFILIGIPQ